MSINSCRNQDLHAKWRMQRDTRPVWPRRWFAHKIRTNDLDFKAKLVRQWQKNREVDFYTSESIQPDARVLEEPALTRLDPADHNLKK